eukprot:PhM_4_TR13156/c0_g1_i2/m.3694
MVNALGNILNIPLVKSRDADPRRLGQVDVVIFNERGALLRRQPQVREHANLARNVLPRARRLEGHLQLLAKSRAHRRDPPGDLLQLVLPLLTQLRRRQDLHGDLRAVRGWGGVVGADEAIEVGLHSRLERAVRTDYGQTSDAFSVQAHVLAVGLARQEMHAVRHQHPRRHRVLLQVTGRIPLISTVTHNGEIPSFCGEQFGELRPLRLGRVRPRWVVRRDLQNEHRPRRHVRNVGHHPGEVDAARAGVEVAVRPQFYKTGVAEDVRVVRPRRVAVEHGRVFGVAEAREEVGRETHGAGAGERLHCGDSLERRLFSEKKADGGLAELHDAWDGEVLPRRELRHDAALGLLHSFEQDGLSRGVAVRADAQVSLVGVGVLFVARDEIEDGIWRNRTYGSGDGHFVYLVIYVL